MCRYAYDYIHREIVCVLPHRFHIATSEEKENGHIYFEMFSPYKITGTYIKWH